MSLSMHLNSTYDRTSQMNAYAVCIGCQMMERNSLTKSTRRCHNLALDMLTGKYVIEGGIHMGDNSIVMNAKQKFNSSSPVVLKFFRQQKYFDVELSLYEQELEFPYIPQVR